MVRAASPVVGVLAAAAVIGSAGAAGRQDPAGPSQLPAGTLAVGVGGAWRTWWSAQAAPARWPAGDTLVGRAVRWERPRPGLERGELDLAGAARAARFLVLLVRLEPERFRFRLRHATRDYGLRGAWNLDSASADAVLAHNAGQFDGGDPWGWLVRDGRELQPPAQGPLSMAVVLEGGGGVALLSPPELAAARAAGGVREAFQSYPTLLVDGEVPLALRARGRGVDVEHRDARLALCTLRDGRLLVALTRYAGMGDVLRNLPIGPTSPEMAALMGALGCRRAVMLDGGLSSQLLLRDSTGLAEMWPGLRRVPLALEAVPGR